MAGPQLYITVGPKGEKVYSDRQPEPTRDMRPVTTVGVGLGPGSKHATINAAATDAIAYARRQPQQRVEYGGWIVRNPAGGYSYTFVDPRENARGERSTPGSVHLGDPPPDAVGAWHTHPRGNDERTVDFNSSQERFSEGDQGFAKYLRDQGLNPGTLYLGAPSGRVRAIGAKNGRAFSMTIAGAPLHGEGLSQD